MNSITFECEVITPMFLAGADGSPELRPSSIKGLMRFWWRAMNDCLDWKKLREKEVKIFGGSAEEQRKSKIIVRISNTHITEQVSLKIPLRKFEGAAYLLYSTLLPQQERSYIKTESTFDLIIKASNEECLKQALASFWCVVYLGGLGSRSRRGAGNIIIKNVKKEPNINLEIDFLVKGNNSHEVAQWLIKNYNKAKNIVSNKQSKFISEYSNLSFSRFIISNSHKNNWIESLNEVGCMFKEFRNKHKSEIHDIGVWGLPIQRNKEITVKGSYSKIDKENGKEKIEVDRRSSPVIFKILKVQDRFYWFVLRLSGEFLPESGIIKTDKNSQKPDYSLIDEFWTILKDNNGSEYILSQPLELDDLVKKIINKCNPKKIILFGSKARGDFHKNSDIDIGVSGCNYISEFIGALDIVDLEKIDNGLREKIEKEGVIIYETKS